MLRNVIKLSDGTRIESGADVKYAIQSCTITESVNSGTELTLGSTCCSCLEATIIDTVGDLSLAAGRIIQLYKADDSNSESLAGIFRLEMPTRKSENIYKITAYDLIADLDVDATQFLKEFDSWGCTLAEFADRLCDYCGLRLHNTDFPNCTFPVPQFYKSGVTGRQIMQWIGEIAGCFCRANTSAEIELAWYTSPDTEVVIRPTGDRYYFAGALTYEDYNVATIDAVKLRLADGENGALWPDGSANNPYIITGNPILLAEVTEALLPYLNSISERLADMDTYKPCKVSLPAGMDIRPGHKVQVEDKHGNQFTTYVMTKTQSGQRDTLECTGSARRDSATATNNKTPTQVAREAVDSQTQQDIFNKLTNNGAIQGIYAQDGKWYINAEQVNIQNLKVRAADITGVITVLDSDGDPLFSAGGNAVKIAGWNVDNNSFYSGPKFSNSQCFFCTGSNTAMSIGGSEEISGWMIKAGSNFGITTSGALYASDAYIRGKIVATSGSFTGTITAENGQIGSWKIGDKTMGSYNNTIYSGGALYSDRFYENGIETEVTLTPAAVFVERRTPDGPDLDYVSWKRIITAVRMVEQGIT